MARSKTPPVIDVDLFAIEQMLERAHTLMSKPDCALIEGLVETLKRVTALAQDRGATIARLRRLFHLSPTEKASNILPECEPSPAAADPNAPASTTPLGQDANAPAAPQDAPSLTPPKPKPKGHGRIPASAYSEAEHIQVPHQTLHTGDRCPDCQKGNLYEKDSSPIVRISGKPPLSAKISDCQVLRCGCCGKTFTAMAPPEAQGPKYDETAISMTALQRYGAGMPLSRLDHLQRNLNTPVPDSTLWDILRDGAERIRPAYEAMQKTAAQGHVLHNDDSYARILQFMGKRRAALLLAGELPDPERTGLFTTGIVSLIEGVGAIALFYTGRQHAGENLAQLLDLRDITLDPPILMSDALSRNDPKGHKVLEANCIAHGRRKVVDQLDNYPTECQHIIKQLALVFKLDGELKEQGASDQERLLAHQQSSRPIMAALHTWMKGLIDQKKVEPNSEFGKDLNYFLKRWDKLTLFLREPGAPLDNNFAERVLKMAIRHRRNSLFYRSQVGAGVGDLFMTLIHTAELHNQNAFDYLTELLRHDKAVAASPADWMPWNYRQTLARLGPKDVAA